MFNIPYVTVVYLAVLGMLHQLDSKNHQFGGVVAGLFPFLSTGAVSLFPVLSVYLIGGLWYNLVKMPEYSLEM